MTAGDDHAVVSWQQGERAVLLTLASDLFPTCMLWWAEQARMEAKRNDSHFSFPFPCRLHVRVPGKRAQSDVFALGTADGRFHLVARAGRVEKSTEGHRGAVTAIQWNHDGSALATAGEVSEGRGESKKWRRKREG